MSGPDLKAADLARAIFDEIAERQQSGKKTYYIFGAYDGLDDDELPDLTDVGLDGRDNLVEICEGALARLVAK